MERIDGSRVARVIGSMRTITMLVRGGGIEGVRLSLFITILATVAIDAPGHAEAAESLAAKIELGRDGIAQLDAETLTPGAYSLGEISARVRELRLNVKWKNDLGHVVTIKDVAESCTCMSVSTSNKVISPAGYADFTGLFDLDRSGNAGLGFLVTFEEATAEPIQYRFDFYRPLEPRASPAHVYFGTIATKKPVRHFVVDAIFDERGREFEINGEVTSSLRDIVCRHISTKTTTMRQPDTLRVSFRHRATFEVEMLASDLGGNFEGVITLPIRCREKTFIMRVPVSGSKVPPILARPDRVVVVALASAQDLTKSITIELSTSDQGRDLANIACKTTDKHIACELEGPPNGNNSRPLARLLNVVIDLGERRSFNGSISVADGDETLEIPVRVRIVGGRQKE